MHHFALCPPGLGPLLRRTAAAHGLQPGPVGHDGRADVVPIRGGAGARLPRLRLAEAVCADVGDVRVTPSLRATVAPIVDGRVPAAVAELRRAGHLGPAAGRRRTPVRLVVRLPHEPGFSRRALRDEVARRLGVPVTTAGDEPAVEVWLVQDRRRTHTLRLGVRVPALEPVRRPRPVERPGSLRPSVAAALVSLAAATDGPDGRHRHLLDPTCGSGTILTEADAAGWCPLGADLDPGALAAAAANAGAGTPLLRLDARHLPIADDGFDAVVANLPFGHQHALAGSPVAWYRRTLAEALRVAARVVVLAPPSTPFRQALGRLPATLAERHDLHVLGRAATIWVIDRRR